MVRNVAIVGLLLAGLLCQGCGALFRPEPGGTAEPAADDGESGLVFDPALLLCSLRSCTLPAFLCVLDPGCRAALACHARCGSQGARTDQQACHLSCQLGRGNASDVYRRMIQCFADNGCLPTLPPDTDGRCPVTSETIHLVPVLDSLESLQGTWREVRGRNCGVPESDWEGGYDALPCRSSSWVFRDGRWWYHTAFCAPTGTCGPEQILHLIAEPALSEAEPGLLEVPYANPPLQPQDESWYVLAIPHPDWVMYTYCGETPVGEYAGVNIMTRDPAASVAAMPPEVETAFRQTAAAFGFSYDEMCDTAHGGCPPVTAEEDVRDWVAAVPDSAGSP